MSIPVKIYENVISKEDCAKAVKFIQDSKVKGVLKKGAPSRWHTTNNKNQITIDILNTYGKKALEQYLGHLPTPLYVTNLLMLMYQPGGCMEKHQDIEGPYQKVPYKNGEFLALTVVAYFNENFEGGELEFPEFNIKVRPKEGTVVVFPGTVFHEVHKVTRGDRFTLNAGFTTNPSVHFSDFPIQNTLKKVD